VAITDIVEVAVSFEQLRFSSFWFVGFLAADCRGRVVDGGAGEG